MDISDLPLELKLEVFKNLTDAEIFNCFRVGRDFRQVALLSLAGRYGERWVDPEPGKRRGIEQAFYIITPGGGVFSPSLENRVKVKLEDEAREKFVIELISGKKINGEKLGAEEAKSKLAIVQAVLFGKGTPPKLEMVGNSVNSEVKDWLARRVGEKKGIVPETILQGIFLAYLRDRKPEEAQEIYDLLKKNCGFIPQEFGRKCALYRKLRL